jgi:hypothetical protein
VLLPDRCGTVPAGRKELGHSLSDRLFCPSLVNGRHPASSAVGGKPGGKIVKRRARRVVAASGRFACGHTSPGRLLPLPAVPEAGVGGRLARPACIARGGARYPVYSCGTARHGTARHGTAIGDVLDSLLALAGDAFYAAEVAGQHRASRHPGRHRRKDSHVRCPADAVTSTRTGTVAVSATTTSITLIFSDQAGVRLPVSSRG